MQIQSEIEELYLQNKSNDNPKTHSQILSNSDKYW